MPKYGSAQEYFDRMSQEITPEQARNLGGTFEFDIEGAGRWMVEFTGDGGINRLEDASREADCTLIAKERNWLPSSPARPSR